MTRQHKWHRVIAVGASIATGTVCLIAGLSVLWLFFWPFHPLTIYGNLVVASPQHSAEKVLPYHATFCKTSDVSASVIVSLNSTDPNKPAVFPVASFNADIPPRCATATIPLHLGIYIPPGSYVLYETITYINPSNSLRKSVVHAHSNVFQVIP